MDRLLAYMRETAARTEARLEELIPHPDLRPGVLHEAMRYSTLGGGKRLRPTLLLASYDASGGHDAGRPAALDAGCAVELLHSYSLIHDDLPVMDNDSMRRNRLACHKAFGEAAAILAGDALQALAFQVLAEAAGPLAAGAVAELAKAAGSAGMTGGQMLDLEGEGKEQRIEEIELIDRWKTGALFSCCCRLGAMLGGAGDGRLEALSGYGAAIGALYQISDDILDITAGADKLGKSPGKDGKAGKLTYPAALGLEGAREVLAGKHALALAAIGGFGNEAIHLRLMADFLLDRAGGA